MAKLLLNLCLDAQMPNVKVVPAGEGTLPTAPPYWFTVYWTQDGDPVLDKGDNFALDRVGPCRVFVWDDEPSAIPTAVGPGSQDPSIRVNLEGTAAIISCGADDPWPRT